MRVYKYVINVFPIIQIGNMREIFKEILDNYLEVKKQEFKDNYLIKKFKNILKNYVPNDITYITKNSFGQGKWAEVPWAAVFDELVTNTAQKGYYPVYLFREDMSGIYLSLNQGVTEVAKTYKKDKKEILRVRAENYRSKIEVDNGFNFEDIDLKISKKSISANSYQHGNIVSKFYSKENLPDETALQNDLNYLLKVYQELIFNDNEDYLLLENSQNSQVTEKKSLRFHYRVERNTSIIKKIKNIKGFTCECCGFNFKEKYGKLGEEFIEAHHLKPISQLDFGTLKLNAIIDFAVLCSNCHRMIHRMEDPSDLTALRKLIIQ